MCPVPLKKKTAVGSLDPSDAVMCHQLAASYGGTNGGLLGNLGTAAPLLDPRSPVGAADFAPATKRGMTRLLQTLKETLIVSSILILQSVFVLYLFICFLFVRWTTGTH